MKMNQPLISVVCTVKNAEKTLPCSVDSVINQTYTNWELLIIDDGSEDGSLGLAHAYADLDPRIKSHQATENGRAKALNQGIKLSRGEFIAIIDADDLFHPQKLEYQTKAFENDPGYALIATDSLVIFDTEKPAWNLYESDAFVEEFDDRLLIRNTIIHSSVMIKKDLLIKIGSYDEKRTMQVDYNLWLRLLVGKHKMGRIVLPLAAKRIHSNQSFENKKRLRYIWSSAKLQWQFLLKSQKYIWLPIPFFVFIYALLPIGIRKKFMQARKSI